MSADATPFYASWTTQPGAAEWRHQRVLSRRQRNGYALSETTLTKTRPPRWPPQFLLDTRRNYPIRVIMPYGDRLQSLARWEQQLLAESLGKTEGNNPIPQAAIGTQDQHLATATVDGRTAQIVAPVRARNR